MPNKIVVADDDQGVLDLLSEVLQCEGYQVFQASNGKEAVEIARETRIDVALLDWKMPLMDGIETLKKVKAIDQNMEVLIMTAYGDPENLDQMLGGGAFDCILKPFHRTEITHSVRNAFLRREFALENKHLKKELEERIVQLEREFEERTRRLRQSQIKYKQLLEHSIDPIVVAQDGMLRFVNPKALELTGYTQEEMLKFPFRDLIHTEDRVMVEKRHSKRSKGEDVPAVCTFRVLRKNEESFWVEANTISILWEGRPATLNIMKDITERMRVQEELQKSMETLRKALDGAIQAMALTVETIDPYTANHQRNVADLALAIATEMVLPKEQLDGIRMAAAIHDIGKIFVPTEILGEPGPISDIEFELIKAHPRVGYDILKNLESQWPIAQIVHQHHERMNGSGYPRGLSGEEIILEARIMAVADTVVAMASHRSYTPAVDIHKALEEISKYKGVLYDPDVVEACLKVINERGFTFK